MFQSKPFQPQTALERVHVPWVDNARQFSKTISAALALPFDVAQAQYARAVQAGLIQPSLLRSRDIAKALDGLQKLLLGPWARRS